ncbi:hypothetical protein I6G97_00510 [Edwardsiella hoshinae]|uniref:Uncharacterized protein n=1 Tax=Edwardsiella hoshinae TaxID=93378 RepID=A0A376D8X9_9GAMM|nr:hypothetical protein [Edwardsiella hoshinae]QPR28183.1 hypothetical protein I6G97_00510 [Edwardsiella hoshinae]STC84518.1 Uncharacterised protein [Edwardsiella hoshinae]
MKITYIYILMFLYYSSVLFIFGLIISIVISFAYLHVFYLSFESIFSAFVKSIIAGSAITLAAIVFNLIDKFNARKKTPSDPK